MKTVSISLSDEDYEILRKAAADDDRKIGNYIASQIVKPFVANLRLVPAIRAGDAAMQLNPSGGRLVRDQPQA